MRWMAIVVLGLLAGSAAASQASEGNEQNGSQETVGAGRSSDGDIQTPWAILMVLGVLAVVAVVAALFFAARGR